MSNQIYKQIELTGSSAGSMEEAVQGAIAKAAETIHNIKWFEVTDIRGQVENQKIACWQVTVKIGFGVDG